MKWRKPELLEPEQGPKLPPEMQAKIMAEFLAERDAEQDRIYEGIKMRMRLLPTTTRWPE